MTVRSSVGHYRLYEQFSFASQKKKPPYAHLLQNTAVLGMKPFQSFVVERSVSTASTVVDQGGGRTAAGSDVAL